MGDPYLTTDSVTYTLGVFAGAVLFSSAKQLAINLPAPKIVKTNYLTNYPAIYTLLIVIASRQNERAMTMYTDTDDELAAPEELSIEDIVREARRGSRPQPEDDGRVSNRGRRIGDQYEGSDGEGHHRLYTVRSIDSRGYESSSGWDAPHLASCPCSDPERWY